MAQVCPTAIAPAAENQGRSGSDNGVVLLGLLSLAYLISAVDRQILALLVEPIKADLHLSDTQMGALQGFAFLIIYATAAIPAGMLADRFSRTALIAGAMSFWSLMTAACGLASGFPALFAARAGVGVGEAVLTPAGYSLIAEKFPARLHARVFGIYHSGASVGAGAAYLVGGYLLVALTDMGPFNLPWIGVIAPWQMTFCLLAMPGLFVASLFMLIREPARPPVENHSDRRRESGSPSDIMLFIKRHWPMLLSHHSAVGFANIAISATAAWTATYFVRVHAMRIDDVGLWLGAATVIGGIAGLLLGGALSDVLFRFGPQYRLWFCTGICAIGGLAAIGFASTPSPHLCAAFFMVEIFCASIPISTGNAALQYLAPSRLCGTTSAVYFFAISLIGSIGPSLTGWVSDHFFPAHDGIRPTMAIIIPMLFFLSALLFAVSVKPYLRSCHDQEKRGSTL